MTETPSPQATSPVGANPSLVQSLGLALLVLVLMIVVSIVAFITLSVITGNDITDPDSISPFSLAVAVFLSISVSYMIIIHISKDYYKQVFLPLLKTNYQWAIGSIAIGIAIAFLVIQGQQWFAPPENMDLTLEQAYAGSFSSKLLVLISVVLLAPFFEEYLFRGLIFDSLKQQLGVFTALMGSAFIFTLFHLFEYYQYWFASVAIFSLAIILAIVRQKSQSILNPILLHASYNSTLMLIGSI